MREKVSNQKTSQHDIRDRGLLSAGPDGMSIVPPFYGIESIDRAAMEAESDPEQAQVSGVPVQMKAALSASDGDPGSPPPNRTSLPDALKTGVESLSGLALDDVHAYANSPRPAPLNTRAYTQGTDTHLAPGQERHPSTLPTVAGHRLPHEAWHVVQQKRGQIKPAIPGSSISSEKQGTQEVVQLVYGKDEKKVKKAETASTSAVKPDKSKKGSKGGGRGKKKKNVAVSATEEEAKTSKTKGGKTKIDTKKSATSKTEKKKVGEITYVYDKHGDKHFPGTRKGTKFTDKQAIVNPLLEALIEKELEIIKANSDPSKKVNNFILTAEPNDYSGKKKIVIQVAFDSSTNEIGYHGYPDENASKEDGVSFTKTSAKLTAKATA